ncbi:MAG: hypothetical protein ACR5KV_03270 [Wolbachia sp.]
MLGKLAPANQVLKINTSNLTDAVNQKAFAEKILPAKDDTKLVLTDELGKALLAQIKHSMMTQMIKQSRSSIAKRLKPTPQEVVTKLIDDTNRPTLANEVAKSSGLKVDLAKSSELQTGVKEKLIIDGTFITNTKTQANAQDVGFQGAVKEVISQSIFKISVDENSPISYDLF